MKRVPLRVKPLLEAAFWGDAETVRKFFEAFGPLSAKAALTGARLPFSAPAAFDKALRLALIKEPIINLIELNISVRTLLTRFGYNTDPLDAMKPGRAVAKAKRRP